MDQFYEYGDPGTDAVPDHVSLQCQWTCSTLDCYWWDVAACTGSELRIYTILRDLELENMLVEAGDELTPLLEALRQRQHLDLRRFFPEGPKALARQDIRLRLRARARKSLRCACRNNMACRICRKW
jgi:hypothetical protein